MTLLRLTGFNPRQTGGTTISQVSTDCDRKGPPANSYPGLALDPVLLFIFHRVRQKKIYVQLLHMSIRVIATSRSSHVKCRRYSFSFVHIYEAKNLHR